MLFSSNTRCYFVFLRQSSFLGKKETFYGIH
ncbi:hypothetical protein F383_38073 [Gossypium arboreum]|uniref:Uncharacterized protein n=1 Tax=Gossypium arboreum TaxID=29729 RepID=A0A0B0MDQ7_GOSAR|nr:hypothetical protein F383_38073 [Gossypium arboreum]